TRRGRNDVRACVARDDESRTGHSSYAMRVRRWSAGWIDDRGRKFDPGKKKVSGTFPDRSLFSVSLCTSMPSIVISGPRRLADAGGWEVENANRSWSSRNYLAKKFKAT